MKKNFLLLSFTLLILRGITPQAVAQNFTYNPYESIGKVAPVLTLSEGRYQEFMTNDTVVQIGSVLFNTLTNEVVSFLEEDSLRLVDADLMTRFLSVDPIGRKYPELTPYQFASNSPISGIDLDGLEYLQTTDKNGAIRYTVMLKVVDNSSLQTQIFPNNPEGYAAYIKAYVTELEKDLEYTKDGQKYIIDIVPTLVINPKEIAEIKQAQAIANEAMREDEKTGKVQDLGKAQNAITGIFALILEDRKNILNSNKDIGNTLLLGGTQGGTQKNIFTVAVVNHIIKEDSKYNENGDYVTTKTNKYVSMETLLTICTTIHEILHGGGLKHPWSIWSRSKDWDASQNNPNVQSTAVKNNRMTSGANKVESAQNNYGTELTKGQLEKVGESIKKDKWQ